MSTTSLSFTFSGFPENKGTLLKNHLEHPERLRIGNTYAGAFCVGDVNYNIMLYREDPQKVQEESVTVILDPYLPHDTKKPIEEAESYLVKGRTDLMTKVNQELLPYDALYSDSILLPAKEFLHRSYPEMLTFLEEHVKQHFQYADMQKDTQTVLEAAKQNTHFWDLRKAILSGTFQERYIRDEKTDENDTISFLLSGKKRTGHAVSFTVDASIDDAALLKFFGDNGWRLQIPGELLNGLFAEKENEGVLSATDRTFTGTMEDEAILPFLCAFAQAFPNTIPVLTRKGKTARLTEDEFSVLFNRHINTMDVLIQAAVKKGEVQKPESYILSLFHFPDQYYGTKKENSRLALLLYQEVHSAMTRFGYLTEDPKSHTLAIGKLVQPEN